MRQDRTDRDPAPARWARPELRKLGTIADVAGAESPRAQSAGNVKS